MSRKDMGVISWESEYKREKMAEDFTLISEASGEGNPKTVQNLREVKMCCFSPGNFYRGKTQPGNTNGDHCNRE